MGSFVLDTSTLSGSNLTYVETPLSERGRSIQISWEQNGSNQDMRLIGYAVRGVAGEGMSMEPS